MQVLQTCWGDSCRWPFKYIHTDNGAPVPQSLWEALSPQYDDVYAKYPWFSWNKCAPLLQWEHENNHFHDTIGSFVSQGRGRGHVSSEWRTEKQQSRH